jgi:predicted phosphodiesterase
MPYVYRHFIPQNTAPSGAQKIGVYDSNGKKVLSVPLGGLTPPKESKLYSFGLISDIHIYPIAAVAWTPEVKFNNALSYFENKGCAFCVHCGDFTQTGLFRENDKVNIDTQQFAKYKEICDAHNIPVYGVCGNHESIYGVPITNNLAELKQYTGTDLYYTIEQGNDLFIFIGQPNYNKVMGDDALTWLQTTLADNVNRRCFVFIHSYIEEDSGDAVDYRENSVFDDWGTTKTEAFMDLMRQYPNAILFHGHSHIKFECQEYDLNATYTERNGFKSVHVPSVGKPRDINMTTGETPEDNNGSQGYIVDVYADCIVLNGWDFVNNQYVPLGVYKIAT